MRYITLGVVVLSLIVSFGSTTAAQETGAAPQITAEDQDKARAEQELVRRLADLVAQYQVGQNPTSQTSTQQATKTAQTWPEVADKVIILLGGSVASIAATIQKYAPEVWRVVVMQQYAMAIAGMIVPWGLLVLCLVYMRIINRWWKPADNVEIGNGNMSEADAKMVFAKVIPLILCFFFVIWGLNKTADAVLLAMNPEYYAVKDILQMVLNPQPGRM